MTASATAKASEVLFLVARRGLTTHLPWYGKHAGPGISWEQLRRTLPLLPSGYVIA